MIKKNEIIKRKISESGLKPTFQRMVIYNFLDKNRIHPSVDDVYEKLHRELPTISKTTIYNTLNKFIDKRLVLGLTIGATEKRYDVNTETHHHFFCTSCGSVFDVPINCPLINSSNTKKQGHLIEEVHSYFKGVCEACRNHL